MREVRSGEREGSGTMKQRARVVESADTADLKSADLKGSWGFKSPLGHQNQQLTGQGRSDDERRFCLVALVVALFPC